MQADVVLVLRLLHLAGNRKSTDTRSSLNKGELRAMVTLSPTKPHLLIVPLPVSFWGTKLSKFE